MLCKQANSVMSPPPGGDEKIALPAFLKILTAGALSTSRAIATTGKIYKTYNTHNTLAVLGDAALISLNVTDKEERKLILAALKKAGFRKQHNPLADPVTAAKAAADSAAAMRVAGPSKQPMSKKRRKRDDGNEYLPAAPPDEGAKYANFDFKEESDEKIIMTKVVHVNRSPVMTAWATVVAERMGFKREEALSIASVYTEMNATSKGISLGIFEQGKGKDLEATPSGGQPYVEFIGRRPVYSTKDSQWRALLKGEPVSPSSAFRYISNAFQRNTSYVLGAMRLLAETIPPKELNRAGFGLYADFRPNVSGWGKKAQMKCSDILALRRSGGAVKGEKNATVYSPENGEGSQAKKAKLELTLEEYEAALDKEDYDGLFSDPER